MNGAHEDANRSERLADHAAVTARLPDPTPDAAQRALSAAGVRIGRVLEVKRLDGGYSWRTYEVVAEGGGRVVLRVAPRGGTVEPYDPAVERNALDAAPASVPRPSVLGACGQPSVLGMPYLVESRVPGRVLRLSDVTDGNDRERYRAAFAAALGKLHRDGESAALGHEGTVREALLAELRRTAERYRRAARWPRPGFEVGLRWLLTHLPASDEPSAFCHGDFRFGNIAWLSAGVIGGVLDWERSWRGDPMAEVAFTRLLSGWCAIDGAAVAIYERHSGRAVDEARVAYGIRFERVRSYTAALLGERAFRAGLSDDPRLMRIGAAGEAGMWELVEWLSEGPLRPLPAEWGARRECAPEPGAVDVGAAVGDLRRLRDGRGWLADPGPAPDHLDPRVCWARVHDRAAGLARTAGPELVPVLRALGGLGEVRQTAVGGRPEATNLPTG